MIMNMKRNLTIMMLLLLALTTWAQGGSALDQLKADPKKSYGTDYPYQFAPTGNCTFEADFAVAVLLHLVKHPIPQPAVWYL